MAEFICIAEPPNVTQKLIRTWVSSGYDIKIVAQSSIYNSTGLVVITSLWRTK